jgi:4-amino-4-deoxy-L-arabinose transferase-like glycosyltransferase
MVAEKSRPGLAVPPVYWLILACLVCLVPFLNKAYHIDDTLFLYAAEKIHENPVDFYGFVVNWYEDTMPMWVVMQNPPLASYYIAIAAALFGWSEPALHLAFLLPAIGVVWGTYRLAVQFSTRPVLAALATLLTPAFLVSSTNVMCDTLMLCFWVWAVVFWERGLRQEQLPLLYLSAGLIGCAALTKYIGVALIPLLLAYTLAYQRGRRKSLNSALLSAGPLWVPVLTMAAYQWLTLTMYERGLLFQAAGYAASVRQPFEAVLLKTVVSLSFLGGAIACMLFYLPLLWSRTVFVIGFALTVVLTVSFARLFASTMPFGHEGGIPWLAILQFGALVAAGFALLTLAAVDWWTHRDAASLLLALWVAGIFVFATFLNWTINVRSILPLLPAVGILIARRLDQRFGPAAKVRHGRLAWPLIPAGVLAVLVTWADYQMAGAARAAAADLAEHCKNHRGTVWHQGHWGFQYYLGKAGIVPLEFRDVTSKPGDLVILPSNNTNTNEAVPPWPRIRPDFYRLDMVPCPWLASMDTSVGAGFYAAVWGPLPFAFGEVKPTRYRVIELAPPPQGKGSP